MTTMGEVAGRLSRGVSLARKPMMVGRRWWDGDGRRPCRDACGGPMRSNVDEKAKTPRKPKTAGAS
jgi:hypothetical protein